MKSVSPSKSKSKSKYGIVNHKIAQFDGNNTICSDSVESDCSCCDNVSICDATISSDSSDYDESEKPIPVLAHPQNYQCPSDSDSRTGAVSSSPAPVT